LPQGEFSLALKGIYRLTSRFLQRSFLSGLKIFTRLQDLCGGNMYFSKSILSAVIYAAGLLAPAMAVAAPDPSAFQADKDQHIATILERIRIDQKNLSCVQEAKDHEALKACDETVKQERDAAEPKVEAPVAEKVCKKEPVADKKIQKRAKNKEK
jgi:hypothetical protein